MTNGTLTDKAMNKAEEILEQVGGVRGVYDKATALEAMEQYAQQVREKYTHCQSCGKLLSRDCPTCKRLWES